MSESVTREVKQLKRTVLFILVKANIFFISQKKKRFLLISFRGFWCRKLPPFETSFSLDFIFVSLFPILYLFLLLLCLTRGFSSSAVDCVFFFKVFYKLHFFVRFFLSALLSSPFFANPKKKKLFLLSEVYFFLVVSSHLHLYVIRGRSSNYPKQSKTARASSFTLSFFFSLSPFLIVNTELELIRRC